MIKKTYQKTTLTVHELCCKPILTLLKSSVKQLLENVVIAPSLHTVDDHKRV